MDKPKKETIIDLVEITKKPNKRERKRVVMRCSGETIDGEFIGGIWKDRKDKVQCPECQRTNTHVSFGIDDAGFHDGGFSNSGGELCPIMGTLNISCKYCKRHFTYTLYGDMRFAFLESATFDERKKALKGW